jgi:hypothetical protein
VLWQTAVAIYTGCASERVSNVDRFAGLEDVLMLIGGEDPATPPRRQNVPGVATLDEERVAGSAGDVGLELCALRERDAAADDVESAAILLGLVLREAARLKDRFAARHADGAAMPPRPVAYEWAASHRERAGHHGERAAILVAVPLLEGALLDVYGCAVDEEAAAQKVEPAQWDGRRVGTRGKGRIKQVWMRRRVGGLDERGAVALDAQLAD